VERRNRTLVEAARTMLTCANLPSFLWAEAITTTCFTQNCSIIHKHFDKTPYELMNKRKPNIKFFRVFGCRCYLLNDYEDVGKLKAKGDIGVFVGYSKDSAAFRIYNKRTRESSSSSLNDDVRQSPEGVILPQTNTQSIPINMIPNGNKASTSHNVFNDQLEDAYFDVSTSFHDPSNVHTYYQPYPHKKKWTKDHPLHKIIGDPKSSTAFLNEILKEEVYVGQPPGFVSRQYPDHVYALDKALYGLKQAHRAWYEVLSQFLIESGSKKYILDILKRFGLENCDIVLTPMVEQAKLKLDLVGKPVDHIDYRSMIGSLMIFRYLKGTINLGLWYPKDSGFDLTAYSDADHTQNYVSISTAESEYVAVSGCCAQVLWMRTQLTDYGFFYDKVPIYCDSKSAIAMSCNPVQHTRTKHIDVRYHVIKDHVEKGTIELYFVGTEYQLADLFTKSLPEARFKFLVEKLGMMSRET
nr:hypothetical protein [Tanacetum cinerariifolium]